MSNRKPFESLYSHGFVRVAVCVPELRVADPSFNVARTPNGAHAFQAVTRRIVEAGGTHSLLFEPFEIDVARDDLLGGGKALGFGKKRSSEPKPASESAAPKAAPAKAKPVSSGSYRAQVWAKLARG